MLLLTSKRRFLVFLFRILVFCLFIAGAGQALATGPWTGHIQEFRARYGDAWNLYEDGASGRPRRLLGGSVPLLDEGTLRAGDPALSEGIVLERGLRFLKENASLLGLPPEALRPAMQPVISARDGHLRVLHFDIAPHGVPVLGGHVSVAVSRGNVISIHVVGTAPVTADPYPVISSGEAYSRALSAAGLDAGGLRGFTEPALFFLPDGNSHRLIWQVTLIEKSTPKRLAARMDARTGEVLSLTDETVQGCEPPPSGGSLRRILGGVRPENAGQPERTELFAFASVEQQVSGTDGFFSPPALPYAGRLLGPVASVECSECSNPASPLAPQGTEGDADFGTGGSDGAGNGRATPADRSAYFHAENARRYAGRWLDLNWFDEVLSIRTNINQTCNAYWDGSGISFFRSSPDCSNTGEIRDIVVHEWGHGLDEHDGLQPPPLSVDAATGEGAADILALLRSRDACIGESFHRVSTSFPSTNCSGVRDLDELAPGHKRGNPGTLSTGNIPLRCTPNGFYRGPLGFEGHCEGEIFGQAFWHLVQNLLTGRSYADGTPLADGPLSSEEAWQTAESLYFDSRSILASYAPSGIQSIGTSAYDAFLIADDEGDGLANGTPHAAAIHDAFLHHGIAETPSAPPDTSGCLPPQDPLLAAATETVNETGLPGVRVTWTDTGASSYQLLRSGDADDAFLPLAGPFGSGPGSYVDRGVLPGRPYYYRVAAVGSDGCLSAGNNTVTGSAGPLLRVAGVIVDDSASGNSNGVLDPQETADLRIAVANVGSGAATNVRVTLESSRPELQVLSGGPLGYGTILPGNTTPGPDVFSVRALAGIPRFVNIIATAEADEGCFRAEYLLEVAQVDLALDGFTAAESVGDGDAAWEPGETADLSVALRNDGLLEANAVTGTLSFRGVPVPGITILQNSASWGLIAGKSAPQIGTPSFSLSADPALGARTKVPLALDVSMGGSPCRRFDITIVVGGFPQGSKEWSAQGGTSSITMTPIILQLDDDDGDGLITRCDVPDVVAAGTNTLAAFSGDNGQLLWELPDPKVNANVFSAITGGDINNDGFNEIVVVNQERYASAVSSGGSILWTTPDPLPGSSGKVSPAPQIWDLDGDGLAEIVIERTVLRGSDGSVVWQDGAGEWCRDLIGDLDLDGKQEIINGRKTYRWDGSDYAASFGSMLIPAGLINLDDDPYPEVVNVFSANPTGIVRAYNHDGSPFFVRDDIPGMKMSPPCFADFDGDGLGEIAVASSTQMQLLDSDGTTLWSVPTTDVSGASGCSAFDFDGDGIPEIIYRDEQNLRIFDASDGEILWQTPVWSGTAFDVPIVADVDGDGSAEIVVTGNANMQAGPHAFGNPLWASARGVWNQENYSVTHVGETGSIVRNPFPRWLSANDFRTQQIVCPCEGPAPEFAFTVPDCSREDPETPDDAGFTLCFSSSVAGGRAPFELVWNFGDGSPEATGANPCHAFPAAGSYPVLMRLEDSNGCLAEAGHLIRLDKRPTVNFDPLSTCAGTQVCFAAAVSNGTAPYEYVWDFGDGSPEETTASVCHTFLQGGSFTVTVFLRDAYSCVAGDSHTSLVADAAAMPEVSPRGAAAPLRVTRQGANLRLTYQDSGYDTGIYQGDLDALRSVGYTHTSSGVCRQQGGASLVPIPAGNVYLLAVAAACETPRVEGSYGKDSAGNARPSAAALGNSPCP